MNNLNSLLDFSNSKKELLAAVIGLVRASVENAVSTENTIEVLQEAFACFKEGSDADCRKCLLAVRQEKNCLAPDCAVCANPCCRTAEYPISEFIAEDISLQKMKADMLFSIIENADFSKDFDRLRESLFLFGYEKSAEQFESFLKRNQYE